MTSDPTAPGDLDLIRRFVNTLDLEAGTEGLATPGALESWMTAAGMPHRPGEADLRRAVAFREALRDVLAAGPLRPAPPDALATLALSADRATVRVRFTAGRAIAMEPARTGLDGALGRLLAIAARADADGTWQRLKVCPADDCRWAFYDRSRNRSRTWCTMDICGNRSKARAFRARTRRDG